MMDAAEIVAAINNVAEFRKKKIKLFKEARDLPLLKQQLRERLEYLAEDVARYADGFFNQAIWDATAVLLEEYEKWAGVTAERGGRYVKNRKRKLKESRVAHENLVDWIDNFEPLYNKKIALFGRFIREDASRRRIDKELDELLNEAGASRMVHMGANWAPDKKELEDSFQKLVEQLEDEAQMWSDLSNPA